MQQIKLTQWEIAQCETSLRERANLLVILGASDDAVKQTRALQERFAAAQQVTILDPRS